MKPDFFFDSHSPQSKPRKLSDEALLDFLEELSAPQYRIVLKARRGWWEMHTTSNQLEGRISVRQAIEDCARERNYQPRAVKEPGLWGRLAAMLGVDG